MGRLERTDNDRRGDRIRQFGWAMGVALLVLFHLASRWAVLEDAHTPWGGRYTVSPEFFVAAINYAAVGEVRADKVSGPGSYRDSPELARFLDSLYATSPAISREELLLRFRSFTRYHQDPSATDRLNHPPLLPVLLGTSFRMFGWSWSNMIVLNLIFSLGALAAVLGITERMAGRAAALVAGFAFSSMLPYLLEDTLLGRDPYPLYFGAILAWIYVRWFDLAVLSEIAHGRRSLVRAAAPAAAAGITVGFGALTRPDCLYFVPLALLFAAIQSARVFVVSRRASRTAAYFLCVSLGFGLPYAGTVRGFAALFAPPTPEQPIGGNAFHAVFAGLAEFGLPPLAGRPAPFQARFDDAWISNQAVEYARRTGVSPNVGYLTADYDRALQGLYLDIWRGYPGFVLSGFRAATHETLVHLARPNLHYRLGITGLETYELMAMSAATRGWYFYMALAGSVLLLLRGGWLPVTYVSAFIVVNAVASGIQWHPRHVLMGYFGYPVLGAGLVVGASGALAWARKRNPLAQVNLDPVRHGIAAVAIAFGIVVAFTIVVALAQAAADTVQTHQEERMRQQADQSPVALTHPWQSGRVAMDSRLRLLANAEEVKKHTYGIQLDLGGVAENLEPIVAELYDLSGEAPRLVYSTTLKVVRGPRVRAFLPVYFFSAPVELRIKAPASIVGWRVLDLDRWKGAFWEGTYDAAPYQSGSR